MTKIKLQMMFHLGMIFGHGSQTDGRITFRFVQPVAVTKSIELVNGRHVQLVDMSIRGIKVTATNSVANATYLKNNTKAGWPPKPATSWVP